MWNYCPTFICIIGIVQKRPWPVWPKYLRIGVSSQYLLLIRDGHDKVLGRDQLKMNYDCFKLDLLDLETERNRKRKLKYAIVIQPWWLGLFNARYSDIRLQVILRCKALGTCTSLLMVIILFLQRTMQSSQTVHVLLL